MKEIGVITTNQAVNTRKVIIYTRCFIFFILHKAIN